MDIRLSGDFVSPSVLNADTDPYPQWSVGHDAKDRADITSYNLDTEHFNQDECGYSVRNTTNRANPNGFQLCKEPSKEQHSKSLQSFKGHINGSSLRSKDRTKFMISPSQQRRKSCLAADRLSQS